VTKNLPERDAGGSVGEAALPLLPTRELVVFPRMVAPLFVGREKSISAIEHAFSEKTPLILSSQREPGDDDPTTEA
jgi:ATP-dependent Lon protease